MRIGLDAHLLGKNRGGVERYMHHLVEHLPDVAKRDEFVVFVSPDYRPIRRRDNVRYVALPFADPIVQRSVLLPWLARRHRLDVLHVQRIAPPVPGCRVVLSVHDLLPPIRPIEPPSVRSHISRLLTLPSLRRADRILAPSQTVRAELVATFGVPAEKVVAVPDGIDRRLFSTEKPAESGAVVGGKTPYALCAGTLEPRKNLEMTLGAFKTFVSRRRERAKLMIVGGERVEGYRRKLELLVEEYDLGRHVEITGFVSDREYLELLRGARLLLAPSRGKGYDLPPVEAMACGIPVICSDIDVHRELLRDHAAFFAVNEPSQLTAQLESLWDDEPVRARLRQVGLERAGTLTWESTAIRIAETYRELDR